MKEFWLQSIVGVVMLGGLAFLGKNTIDMSRSLGSVDTKVSLTSERVDRIAEALPDLRIRVAHEEVSESIRTVVVTSDPRQLSDGAYAATVTVIDLEQKKRWTAPVRLQSLDDRQSTRALAWAASETDDSYVSFGQLQKYSKITDPEVKAASLSGIDASTSFVLRKGSGDEFLAKASWLNSDEVGTSADVNGENWEELIKSLAENQKKLGLN